jgi:hypothetical protein
MNSILFDKIIKSGESDLVDFKEVGYFAFSSATSKKDKDADFLKDILSFANTMRDEAAYIIIGVKDNGERIGIGDHGLTDGSVLQAKIKDKTYPLPKFLSYPYHDSDGKKYQIIEIPVSWYSGPCLPTVTIGNQVERGTVYIRRLSSNEKATPDEIAKLYEWLKGLPRLAEFNSKAEKKADENASFQFDEITIQKLFGNEAAEDEDAERLKEYYFKNDIFDQIAVDLPLRILVGHKGIGKSALFNVAVLEDRESGRLPITIRPDDVANLGKHSTDTTDFSSAISNWREGLMHLILRKTFLSFGIRQNMQVKLSDIEGNFVDFIVEKLTEEYEQGTLPLHNKKVLESFLQKPIINTYIDDLDRGWEGTKSDISKISALLNAVRDIIRTENRKLQFKISLRSDVYFLYRTSDESTDKTQGSVIWYRWTLHEILGLLVKRVRTHFGKKVDESLLRSSHQADLATNLVTIMEPVFSGQGKWENKAMYQVLLSVIRKRPRDLVKLLTLAARSAKKRNSSLITTKDLKSIFDEYSLDRIQDTINEYKSELPAIERLIFGMKPASSASKASENFYYKTQELLLKINKIRERGEFRFANGKSADAKELAAFLYKINFITATKRKEEGGYIERKDFEENRYLVPKFEDFGYDWEVHMAFRWGLQPTESHGDIYTTI